MEATTASSIACLPPSSHFFLEVVAKNEETVQAAINFNFGVCPSFSDVQNWLTRAKIVIKLMFSKSSLYSKSS